MTTYLTGEPAMGFTARGGTLDVVNSHRTFEALFVAEYSKMVALAAATSGDRSQAEDIAQEAFSKLNQKWDKVSHYDKPGAWIRRVTINLALSKKRKLKVRRFLVCSQKLQDTALKALLYHVNATINTCGLWSGNFRRCNDQLEHNTVN